VASASLAREARWREALLPRGSSSAAASAASRSRGCRLSSPLRRLTSSLPPHSTSSPYKYPMRGEGKEYPLSMRVCMCGLLCVRRYCPKCGTFGILYRVSADGGTSSPVLEFKVWSSVGDSGSRLSTSVGIFLILRFRCEMAGSPAQSDPELTDHFEDWFSDVDLTLVDVNSSVLVADYRQALDLVDAATNGTSVPSSDAQAVASGTADSEFQVVPSLPGMDTPDSLSVYTPSPLTVSNSWSPLVSEQALWEPWPVVWELRVAVVPLPAPPLTITLRTIEGDLVVAKGYIQLLYI
ncbi:hypothetical protein Taro_019875, partial [Colocasia esculenta]|nr:hypothetical protein [Colocasia esculenta]